MKETAYGERVEYVLHDRALKRAEEIYDKKMTGRRMKDFIGDEPYTEEAIVRIETQVANAEEFFQAEVAKLPDDIKQKQEVSKSLADTLEGIILNVQTWFGPTSVVYPTTRYDDYFNGVDLVAERMKGGVSDHHGFALDITYAGYNTIFKKLNRILDRLKEGKLGKVDFFKSNDGRFKGQLNQIPLVVVGVDGNTMRGLVNMFAEKEDQKIEEHQAQFQITEQVIMQCEFFIAFAEQMENKEHAENIIRAYKNLLRDFTMIENIKYRLGTVDKQERDSFHANLSAALENLEK